MAFLSDPQEIYSLYTTAVDESHVWRKDYHEYERLADNDLLDDLDENLPEVNDGSLAASLFKLPKRIVNSNLSGRVKCASRDETWLTEIANIQWENKIIPNANQQAPFHRKWKDAVRKAAIYGSVPLITLFVERGDYTGADFIVAQPQDVTLEPGKVSDYDSDIMFWDVYFTDLQLKDMIEQAQSEDKQSKKSGEDGYNKWDVPALKEILKGKQKDERSSQDDYKQKQDKSVEKGGFHFCIVVQRGKDAPFYMYHKQTKTNVREWTNPDPTGDVPIHFLYCYQDFINPYGIGIVKLAGGTQNVLDYMRQADVLATQLGFRPPVSFKGNTDNTDFDSIIYAQDAQWIVGEAEVQREEIATDVYRELPNRINMYKSSLNQLIPMGDTSVGAAAGDPLQSKTPAGVKLASASLSIDDDDFKDNLYMTYEAKVKSMINTHFANMQGSDLMRLDEEERDILSKAGIQFPQDPNGQPTNEFELAWDQARGEFDFTVDAETDKTQDEQKRLDGLLKVAEFSASDPLFDERLLKSGKKLNRGELYSEVISLTSDNDKILEDVSPEEQQGQDQGQGQPQLDQSGKPVEQQQPKTIAESIRWTPADLTPAERAQVLAQGGVEADPSQPPPSTVLAQQAADQKTADLQLKAQAQDHGQTMAEASHVQNAHQHDIQTKQNADQFAAKGAMDGQKGKPDPKDKPQPGDVQPDPGPDPQAAANMQAVMEHHNVDQNTAAAMLEAERQGYDPQQILDTMQGHTQPQEAVNV